MPERSYNDTKTAIYFGVNNGGWRTSAPRDRIADGAAFVSNSNTDNVGAALKAGYIVVNAGTRSRGAKAADGSWAGKAPAVVVDAKAAIRYLRLNDAVMPGSAERILITGVSGGGGLSVAVAASGNSPDYSPTLRRSVRPVSMRTARAPSVTTSSARWHTARSPISATRISRTSGNTTRCAPLRTRRAASIPRTCRARPRRSPPHTRHTCAGLGLKLEDGTPLTADNMDDAIVALVKKETEETITEGVAIPAIGENFVIRGRRGTVTIQNDWLTVEKGEVKSIDYAKYLGFVTSVSALKTVPAFDATAVTGTTGPSGENSLFGSDKVDYSNFMEYAWNNNEVKGDGSGSDDIGVKWAEYVANPSTTLDDQIKMVSPMPYLSSAADAAPYWYVRHGLLDRDTSFAVEVALYYAIRNDPSVKDVSFELAWLQGHGGNYDVQEAFAWIARILAEAGDR